MTTPSKFMALQQPDAVLAALVGADPISRPEITKRLWAYIKAKGLQGDHDRRRIYAESDVAFRAFLGGADSCTMFELPQFTKAHTSPATPA